MHWLVVGTVAGADIHVVNRAVSTASPGARLRGNRGETARRVSDS